MSNPITKSQFIAALTAANVAIPRKAKLEVLQGLWDALDVVTQDIVAPIDQPVNEFSHPEEGGAPYTQAEVETGIALIEAEQFEMSAEELAAQVVAGSRTPTRIEDTDCPACGIHLSNGVLHLDDEAPNSNGATLWQLGLQHGEHSCMGCGAEFGDVRAPYVAPAPLPTGTGLKIEKDRAEQNGVKRPSVGGKCRAIWDALDEYRAETGELPTSKTVKALAADSGWNPNNASIEFYQWRKFNGIAKA